MAAEHSLTDLLTIYLYKNKYLSLPKLGRFEVSEGLDLAHPESIKFSRIPKDSIIFSPNTEEETDVELVRYITQRTRKMHSLAVADLFTLTDQARQMLNIFQPITYNGIGTLSKSTKGNIEFTPGIYRANLLHEYEDEPHLPDYSESPVSTMSRSMPARTQRTRSFGGVVIIIICLIVVGGLIYFMISHNSAPKETVVQTEENTPAPKVDSPKITHRAPVVPPDGKVQYEVVFEHLGKERALKRYQTLTSWGHHVVMRTKDSVQFMLAIPFTTLAADTSRMKDSIRILYGHPVYIQYVGK